MREIRHNTNSKRFFSIFLSILMALMLVSFKAANSKLLRGQGLGVFDSQNLRLFLFHSSSKPERAWEINYVCLCVHANLALKPYLQKMKPYPLGLQGYVLEIQWDFKLVFKWGKSNYILFVISFIKTTINPLCKKKYHYLVKSLCESLSVILASFLSISCSPSKWCIEIHNSMEAEFSLLM